VALERREGGEWRGWHIVRRGRRAKVGRGDSPLLDAKFHPHRWAKNLKIGL